MDKPESLSSDAIADDTWSRLERGVADRRSAFHTPVVATVAPDGTPDARCVVLREASRPRRELLFHADVRSEKVRHVRASGRVTWVFYDAEGRVQVRAFTTARVHAGDALADDRWRATHPMSREAYRTLVPPGGPLGSPRAGANGPIEIARSHFAVVVTTVLGMDRLDLDARGHRRCRIEFKSGAAVVRFVQP